MRNIVAVFFVLFLISPSFAAAQEEMSVAQSLFGMTEAADALDGFPLHRGNFSKSFEGNWVGSATPTDVEAKVSPYACVGLDIGTFLTSFSVTQTGKRVSAVFGNGLIMFGKAKRKMILKVKVGSTTGKLVVSKNGTAKFTEKYKLGNGARCIVRYKGNLQHFPRS